VTLAAILFDFFVTGLDTVDALPSSYDPALVLVSYLVASLASYTFLQFASRIVELRHSVMRFAWLGAGAVMMGVGIWAMHFVGMLAYILPIRIAYDIIPTFLSVVPAILAATIALYVVARPAVTTRHLLIGGTLMGAGIGLMHYGGMTAVSVNALVRYDPVLFGASIVAAVALAVLALQVRFWVGKSTARSGAEHSTGRQEIVGALILGFAVTSMHYIAMASTYCFASPGIVPFAFDAGVFAGITAVIASLVLLMAIAAVGFDRRMKIEIAMRQKADANVAAEIERLNSVFQSTGAVVLMLDGAAKIVMVNHAVLEMLGLSAQDVAGRPVGELKFEGFDESIFEHWRAVAGTEHLRPVEFECSRARRDGAKRVFRLTANPVQDQSGDLRYIVLIGVDDTERRLAEIRLFDSSRLANLGEMATGMAHEINQPLAVIRMAADSVLEELDGPEAEAIPAELAAFIKAKLARISNQTERASTLVNELRTVARKPANDSLPFDVADAVRVSNDLLREQLKAARIEFKVEPPPPGLMVRGVASRLQQVIINLALNARDALHENPSRSTTGSLGHITLSAAVPPAGGVMLTLADDGPGIPVHVLPRLFEPFFTTKPTGKGTGLGLSISYDIIKRMGGEITAENRPEGGARFTIVLPPLSQNPSEQRTAA
jgi:PAS domain S-box-containing protein